MHIESLNSLALYAAIFALFGCAFLLYKRRSPLGTSMLAIYSLMQGLRVSTQSIGMDKWVLPTFEPIALGVLLVFSIGASYFAAKQPKFEIAHNEWFRWMSWCGFIALGVLSAFFLHNAMLYRTV